MNVNGVIFCFSICSNFEFLGENFFVKIRTHTDHFSHLLSPKNIELLEETRGENIYC